MKKNSGFTLIELLVVIAIIGILASILIPNVIGGIETARASKDASNLHQLGIGLIQYLNQNENTMFTTSGTGSWQQTLQQFVPDWRTFQSPFDKRTNSGTAPYPVSYGLNAKLYGTSTSQFTYPSQLIVIAGSPDRAGSFTGISSNNYNATVPLVQSGNKGGGTFRGGNQLNVLFADSHAGPLTVSLYNDQGSTNGQRQWIFNAQ